MMTSTNPFQWFADVSAANSVMHGFIAPVIESMSVIASLVCIFFLVNAGIQYITSSGKPERLEHAKGIIRNALIGLILVLGAGVLTAILAHAYASSGTVMQQKLPTLTAIPPQHVSNGIVDILVKAITGLLNNIIQSIATPFLKALTFFTSSTPLLAANSSVFNLWLVVVGITDSLFVLAVALLGFHVMSASSFGFEEIEFKHLLPKLGLVFLLINTSLFAIDGMVALSNILIKAVQAGGPGQSVWDVLTGVAKDSGGLGVAALLIMIAFLIFAVILLIYYVGRLVTLYIGAVMAPLVLLLWIVPGFRDFAESAAKTYLTTIFILFVHVVILLLAASLFQGLTTGVAQSAPDTLMALVLGLATVIALLKTQGVMMQFSYASLGPRSARKLGGQFINGVSSINRTRSVVTHKTANVTRGNVGSARSTSFLHLPAKHPQGGHTTLSPRSLSPPNIPKPRTGTTTIAPPVAAAKPKVMEKP